MNRILLASGVLLSLSLAGCGGADVPEVGEVTGTVTIDGKPGKGVIVNFTPMSGGRTSTAVTDDEGRYELQYSPDAMGALIGPHQVTIADAGPPVDAPEPGAKGAMLTSSIPRKYTEMKKPAEVKEGDNTIDLTYP